MSAHSQWADEVEACVKNEPGCNEQDIAAHTDLSLQTVRDVLYRVCAFRGRIFWIGQTLPDRRFYFSGD